MDFTNLSNEQVLDLLRELMAESIKRNITSAAREVLLTEKEKAEIRDVAERRAAEKAKQAEIERIEKEATQSIQDKLRQEQNDANRAKLNAAWLKKKEFSEKLVSLLKEGFLINGDNIWINVWNGTDKRVYINNGEPFGKKTKELSCYYATGSTKVAPGTLGNVFIKSYCPEGKDYETFKGEYIALMKELAAYYKETRFSTKDALQYESVI